MVRMKILQRRTLIYIMNLQARLAGLIIISALFFWNCERYDLTVGFPPQEGIIGTNYYEFTPPSTMVWADSVNTFGNNPAFIGASNDPIFGFLKTETFAVMEYSDDDDRRDVKGTLDSVRLNLVFNYLHGDNPSLSFDFHLHRIIMDKVEMENYKFNGGGYTFHKFNLDTLVMSFPYLLDQSEEELYRDTLSIDFDAYTAQVLFDSVSYYDTINYEQIGDNDNDGVNDTTIVNLRTDSLNRLLQERWIPAMGLSSELTDNGILGINLGASGIKFYFSDKTETTPVARSFSLKFSSRYHHSYVSPNRDENIRVGTPMESLTQTNMAYDPGDGNLYYQNATGERIVLDLSDLLTYADTLQNYAVTNAIIEMTEIQGMGENVEFPSSLRFFLTDESLQKHKNANGAFRELFEDNFSDSTSVKNYSYGANSGLSPILFIYDEENNKYVADIARYVKSLFDKEADLSSLLLIESLESTGSDETNDFNRFYVNKNNIKLKIFYSKRLIEQ